MTVEEHASALESLRYELGALREHGGISEQFADWHRRLVVCLKWWRRSSRAAAQFVRS
jgi:hypothetical protein